MLSRLRYFWNCDNLRVQLRNLIVVQLQLAQSLRVRNRLVHYHVDQLLCVALLELDLNMIVQVGVIINKTIFAALQTICTYLLSSHINNLKFDVAKIKHSHFSLNLIVLVFSFKILLP